MPGMQGRSCGLNKSEGGGEEFEGTGPRPPLSPDSRGRPGHAPKADAAGVGVVAVTSDLTAPGNASKPGESARENQSRAGCGGRDRPANNRIVPPTEARAKEFGNPGAV